MNYTGKRNLIIYLLFFFFMIFNSENIFCEDFWLKKERIDNIETKYENYKNSKYSEIRQLKFMIERLKRAIAVKNTILTDNYLEKAEFLITRIEFRELSLNREVKKIKEDIDDLSYVLSIHIEKLKAKLKYEDFLKKYNEINELFKEKSYVKCSKLLKNTRQELSELLKPVH